MWKKYVSSVWVWRLVPIGVLLAIRLVKEYQAGYLGVLWPGNLWLLAGWTVGWFLADADHLFYATMCNPQELTCQRVRAEIGNKNWRNAWGILKQTENERTRLPIRNILTGFVMTGVGLWLISSGASLLAAGTTFGFSVRLFSEVLFDIDYQKWYWLFAKKFELSEHQGLLLAWGAVLIWQWSMLARG
jgi:hypothetical protein